MTKFTLVVARGRNGVIGADGAIPWRLSSDMAGFKAYTMGKPVLMGRKTWESFPRRPLPGRPNLVLTRDGAYRAPGAWLYADLDVMRAAADAMHAAEACVIGGAQIYDLCLPFADRIRLTEVDLAPAGDARFAFDEAAWRETAREAHSAGPKDDAAFVVRMLERV